MMEHYLVTFVQCDSFTSEPLFQEYSFHQVLIKIAEGHFINRRWKNYKINYFSLFVY